jgi:hypothetical protein
LSHNPRLEWHYLRIGLAIAALVGFADVLAWKAHDIIHPRLAVPIVADPAAGDVRLPALSSLTADDTAWSRSYGSPAHRSEALNVKRTSFRRQGVAGE